MIRPSFFAAAVLSVLTILGTPTVADELATIEVTLPEGVSLQDPFPTTKPSLRPPTMAPVTIPTLSPSVQPTMRNPSIKETKFRQEFEMRGNVEFSDDELALIETIYQRYTVNFAPLPPADIKNKIVTTCTIQKQLFVSQETTSSTLSVDYTMAYESIHYNVEEYPKLFQNWATQNLDVVLEQLQFLNFDVVSVDIPKRIVVMTPSPSYSPTSMPTATLPPTITKPDTTKTIAPTVMEKGNGQSFNIIMLATSVAIAFGILAVGLFVYCARKRRANQRDEFKKNSGTIDTAATGMSHLHREIHKKHKAESKIMSGDKV